MIYLPDTNAVSVYLKGRDEGLVNRMNAEFVSLRLSSLVVAERGFGIIHHAAGLRYSDRFETLLKLLPIEPFTSEDARHYAEIRSRLEKRGQGIGPIDTLIAAQGLRLGATVITHNLREYRRVPGLKVEDWQTVA
jgi:tRNA(fMet)-specific endonuclease VapC